MSDIGKRIREKREFIGITQEDLAEKLGYKNKSTIAKIENGTNDIVQSKVVEFANVLGTSVAYLMGWEEKSKIDNITTKEEQNHLHKYRSIDEKGKHTVDTVLEMEYNRCNTESFLAEEESSYTAKAAHNDFSDNPVEQDKIRRDMDKLKRPSK